MYRFTYTVHQKSHNEQLNIVRKDLNKTLAKTIKSVSCAVL